METVCLKLVMVSCCYSYTFIGCVLLMVFNIMVVVGEGTLQISA